MSLLADYTGLINSIKKAALEAIGASKPVSVIFGRVAACNPLIVAVGLDIRLKRSQLIFTEGHNNFFLGDELAMLQAQGGQRFLVIGKVVDNYAATDS